MERFFSDCVSPYTRIKYENLKCSTKAVVFIILVDINTHVHFVCINNSERYDKIDFIFVSVCVCACRGAVVPFRKRVLFGFQKMYFTII